MNHQLPQKH